MNTQTTGRLAENYAHNYLRACNYHVVERNWTSKKAEIDIIAQSIDTKQLVFVEVKALHAKKDPLDNFSVAKEINFKHAVEKYLDQNKLWDHDFRFDVITMNIAKDQSITNFAHYDDIL